MAEPGQVIPSLKAEGTRKARGEKKRVGWWDESGLSGVEAEEKRGAESGTMWVKTSVLRSR